MGVDIADRLPQVATIMSGWLPHVVIVIAHGQPCFAIGTADTRTYLAVVPVDVSILVSVLRYLVASHLCLLCLCLRSGHSMLVLPLREVIEPGML
jgi:hypothetical protein